MTRRRDLPDALDPDGFSVRRAVALDVAPDRLRALDLIAPSRGVRVRADADLAVIARAVIRELPGMAISHATAAAIHGLWSPLRLHPWPLHISAMGDGLVAWRQARVGVDDLRRAVRRASGRRGAGRLRAALKEIRAGSASPAETRLRLKLVRAGVPEPELNGEIRDARGRLLGHGDLVWHLQRVIVEYEGDQHRTDARQFRIDLERIERLAEAGWRVIRVGADAFSPASPIVRQVRATLASADEV